MTDKRPRRPSVEFDANAIPIWLAAMNNRFACWEPRWDDKRQAWAKPPLQFNGNPASSTNPDHWTDFGSAVVAAKRMRCGLAVRLGDGLLGIDLDHIMDDPARYTSAYEIARRLEVYTEWSPSGYGWHLLCLGDKPVDRCRRGWIEMYDSGRYFTLTGNNVGIPYRSDGSSNCGGLHDVCLRYLDTPDEPASLPASRVAPDIGGDWDDAPVAGSTGPAVHPNDKVLAAMFRGRGGDALRQLYDYGKGRGRSASEDDARLAAALCYYTDSDEQVALIMRESALARAKYDERRGQETYLELTIRKARETQELLRDPNYGRRPQGGTPVSVAPERKPITSQVLGELLPDTFDVEPPPREYLLYQERGECMQGMREQYGWLPSGICALLVGAGGVGKSTAILSFAISVATGKKWLQRFSPKSPGRVLLAAPEDGDDELRRRLYYVAKSLDMSADQKKDALKNIVALPLRGVDCTLCTTTVTEHGHQMVPTPFWRDLRSILRDGDPWSVVILDPLSRFSPERAETSNWDATKTVEAIEALIKGVPGDPTVLVAHHTSQAALRAAQEGRVDQTYSRGATGLVDGCRAMMTFTSRRICSTRGVPRDAVKKFLADVAGALTGKLKDARRVRLEMHKSNYAHPGEAVDVLIGEHGNMYPIMGSVRAQLEDAKEAALEAVANGHEADSDRAVRAFFASQPVDALHSVRSIADAIGFGKSATHDAVCRLIDAGVLERDETAKRNAPSIRRK